MADKDTYTYLTEHGIRPSVQRLAIMEFLLKHRIHPTADIVYQALSKKMPILSKTTVYNTLNAFVEANAVTPITIDAQHVCFDVDTTPHAHFLCKECGRLLDLPGVLVKNTIGDNEIDGNEIEDVHLYYKGTCCQCKEKLSLKK